MSIANFKYRPDFVGALVMYCLRINYPKMQWLKATTIYYLIVSVGWESRHSLTGCLWLRVSFKATIKIPGGTVVSSQGSAGGRAAFKLTHVAAVRSQVLAGCWSESSVPCHAGLYIQQFTIGSKRGKKGKRAPESHSLFVTSSRKWQCLTFAVSICWKGIARFSTQSRRGNSTRVTVSTRNQGSS